MRYINRENVRAEILKYRYKGKNWLDAAKEALDVVRRVPPEKRGEEIEKRSDVWRALKEALWTVSNGKCWYCESIDSRHDDEVDHWRPKGAVYECDKHPGYWWLAFDWENFRYACTFCNQRRVKDKSGNIDEGGKETQFPLLDPDRRIFDECQRIDLLQEEPVLLDPMVRGDTFLLKFEIDGTVHPAKSKEENLTKHDRALKSIEIYHLKANDLVEKRRTTVCNQVMRLISDGDAYYRCMIQSKNNFAAIMGYSAVLDQLSYMIQEKHEYSMAARSVMISYSKTYSWLQDVMEENG